MYVTFAKTVLENTTGFAITIVWVSNAIPRPPAKRSAAIAIVNGIGNLGNVYALYSTLYILRTQIPCPNGSAGSYAWKSVWGPDYHQSMFIGIGSLVAAWLLAFGKS